MLNQFLLGKIFKHALVFIRLLNHTKLLTVFPYNASFNVFLCFKEKNKSGGRYKDSICRFCQSRAAHSEDTSFSFLLLLFFFLVNYYMLYYLIISMYMIFFLYHSFILDILSLKLGTDVQGGKGGGQITLKMAAPSNLVCLVAEFILRLT